jgi:hypothetical protein
MTADKTAIYRSTAGEREVRDRYLDFLRRWPVAHEQLRIPTREGETFVMASGAEAAPPLLLLHGSGANTAMRHRPRRRSGSLSTSPCSSSGTSGRG